MVAVVRPIVVPEGSGFVVDVVVLTSDEGLTVEVLVNAKSAIEDAMHATKKKFLFIIF